MLRESTNGALANISKMVAYDTVVYLGRTAVPGTNDGLLALDLNEPDSQISFDTLIPLEDVLYTIGIRVAGGFLGAPGVADPVGVCDDVILDMVRFSRGGANGVKKLGLGDHVSPIVIADYNTSLSVAVPGAVLQYTATLNGSASVMTFSVTKTLQALNLETAIWIARRVYIYP